FRWRRCSWAENNRAMPPPARASIPRLHDLIAARREATSPDMNEDAMHDISAGPTAKPADHPPALAGRIGVLLVNLGTPDGTSYWPMRRYLKEFLSDRRVIEASRLFWWPLLNLVILTTRPSRSGAKYASIWDREKNASPLLVITQAQTEKLRAMLA